MQDHPCPTKENLANTESNDSLWKFCTPCHLGDDRRRVVGGCRDCTDCRNTNGRRPPRWSKPKATLVAVGANPYSNHSRHLTRRASKEYMEKSPTRTKRFEAEQPHRTPASADAILCLRRPRWTAWVSTHIQQGAPKVKPDGNVESLAPDYCNRVWGITAETIRCSWDAATLPAADLTYDDIVPGDEE